jgi:hypothetical protein
MLEVLEKLLARRAAQLEIAAALPVRSWEAIREKFVQLHGDSSMVTETGQMADGERISDFLERHPSAAGAMPFLILRNYSRTSVLKEKKPQLRRFNLARLQPIEFSLIENPKPSASTHTNNPTKTNADQPHVSARSVGVPPDSNGGNRE